MAKKASMPAEPEKHEDGSDKDWEADGALRDIERYHEHKSNPKLMERVKKRAGRKLKALTGLHNEFKSLDDIRSYRDKKYGPQGKCPGCGKKMIAGNCTACD